MVKVNIKFLSTFHSVVDDDDLEFKVPKPATLGKVLDLLSKRFGEALAEHFRRLEYLMIFVNDVEYRRLRGLDTLLKDGDKITIGHVAAGGAAEETHNS